MEFAREYLRGPALALVAAAAWVITGTPLALTGPALWWMA